MTAPANIRTRMTGNGKNFGARDQVLKKKAISTGDSVEFTLDNPLKSYDVYELHGVLSFFFFAGSI